ncbi:hypothetical protein [Massilia timonae]|uniref:Uncharacterized protein n=1 Tax=Massilia timonae TaxID=47229 RepID=A0A1S2NBE7_9BURK|nr:hypothetical protein [Massilia timonae]OIJ42417.1 hypothetical protein LO55_5053 [Massilia timonae]
MLAQSNPPAVHAGEDQSSPPGCLPVMSYGTEPRERAESEAETLSQLVIGNDWLRAGDVVYITETRRHTLTDADLNAAARAVIGGAA